MSTNNFKFDNVLAVTPDFRFENICLNEDCRGFEKEDACEHTEGEQYYDFDQEGFDIFIKEAQDDLIEAGFEASSGHDDDRNYTGNYIAEKTIENSHGERYKKVVVLWRPGYYQGANMDYITEDLGESEPTSFLDSKVGVVERLARRIILKHCEEYLKVAQFSNGEAVYKKK